MWRDGVEVEEGLETGLDDAIGIGCWGDVPFLPVFGMEGEGDDVDNFIA